MNIKSIGITAVIVFAAVFGIEFLIHGILLKDIYKETAALWRPEADMKLFMPYMTAAQVIFAVVFAALFARCYETGRNGLGQGLRYGIWIALLMAPASSLMWYAILPIPQTLAVFWFAGGFVETVVLGLIAGLVYKPR